MTGSRMVISGERGGSLHPMVKRILASALVRSLGLEGEKIEKQYGDISVVTSAISVIIAGGPALAAFAPLVLTTCTIAHSLLHWLFSAAYSAVSAISWKVRRRARDPVYLEIQKKILPHASTTARGWMRNRLLLRHQDRGCSKDSAPHDNLLRRKTMTTYLQRCEQRQLLNKLSEREVSERWKTLIIATRLMMPCGLT